MQGDKVIIGTTATEENNELVFATEVSPKPGFMLDEEYKKTAIDCVVNSLIAVCRMVYPSVEAQSNLANHIAKIVVKELEK